MGTSLGQRRGAHRQSSTSFNSSKVTPSHHNQPATMNSKFLFSFLALLLACSMVSMVSCAGSRQLQQNAAANVFPLDLEGASGDLFEEFFDEYLDGSSFLPETYGYDESITAAYNAFGQLFGQFIQNAYNSANPGR